MVVPTATGAVYTPRSPHERDVDAAWAQTDPWVEEHYGGQWVVPYRGQVIAHGVDSALVLDEAEQLTWLPREEFVVCRIMGLNDWFGPNSGGRIRV